MSAHTLLRFAGSGSARSSRFGEGMFTSASVTAPIVNEATSARIANGMPLSRPASQWRNGPSGAPRRASTGSEISTAAAAGERMPLSAQIDCIMPLARGRRCGLTSMATEASNEARWNAPVRQ